MPRSQHPRETEGGSILVLALFLVLVLAVAGAMLVRHAGRDRIAAAQMATKERAFACAEAGLQYGRRFFGRAYEASHGWNDYLRGGIPGYTYVASPDLSRVPLQVLGASDGSTYDAGAAFLGNPQFWVSIRDDDDERPSGNVNDPARDNNEAVYLRSECILFFYVEGGQERTAALEVLLTHVQSASGYGNAQVTSNSPDVLGQLGTTPP